MADDIRAALEETLRVHEQRRQCGLHAIYYREIVSLKAADPSGNRLWAAAKEPKRRHIVVELRLHGTARTGMETD